MSLEQIHTVLLSLKEDSGATRADVAAIKSTLSGPTGIEARLREVELKQSHDRGRNSAWSAVVATVCSVFVAWIGRHF